MEWYIIEGGHPLNGEISLQGSKNASLPQFAASILNRGVCVLKNCPDIADIRTAAEILEGLGCTVEFGKNSVKIDSSKAFGYIINRSVMKKMRSSIVFAGSILSVNKSAAVHYPGGCPLGERPVNIHIDSLKKLNVKVYEIGDAIFCFADDIAGNEIELPFPSVGATENIILASVKCRGKTVIYNPAKEPEITDLQNFLNAMGADVYGAGSDKIVINGVKRLKKYTEYTVMPDRIAAVTYLAAAGITGGAVNIKNVRCEHIRNELEALKRMGFNITEGSDSVRLESLAEVRGFGKIETNPYPGFPTDSQPFMCVLASVGNGKSVIEENIFSNRFRYVEQLKKMGLNAKTEENRLEIEKSCLEQKITEAEDLRGGAALMLAHLGTKGIGVVKNTMHIDRGYENIEGVINKLGGKVYKLYGEEKNDKGK